MNADSLVRKIIACLIAGLTGSALILQIGRDYRPVWVSPPMVFSLAGAVLLAALIYSFVWHIKKKNNESVFNVVLGVLCYSLSFGIALFGWKKIFKLQFQVPLSMTDQPLSAFSGEWLTWAYFGYSYPFGVMVALTQLGGALLLLFPKTRLAGVFILLPVLLNILFINVFYRLNAGALLQSVIFVIALIYLLSLHYEALIDFFFQKMKGPKTTTHIYKNLAGLSAIVLPLLLVYPAQKSVGEQLTGVYDVVDNEHTLPFPSKLSAGLSKVYFDLGSVLVLEYGSYKNRRIAAYSYNRDTHVLKADFVNDTQAETLWAELKKVDDRLWMKGKTNGEVFSIELKSKLF